MTLTTSEALNLTADFEFEKNPGLGYSVWHKSTQIGNVWRNDRGQWRADQMNGKMIPGFHRSREVAAHWLAVTPVVGDAFDGLVAEAS